MDISLHTTDSFGLNLKFELGENKCHSPLILM